jgi:hypothetical protein
MLYYIQIKGNNLRQKEDKEMYKDNRYINAGQNEFYRWGHKAVEKLQQYLEPNENGFYAIPVDGGKYYTIGTSNGKYGEFAKYGDTFLSVNKAGNMWAKVGTDKAEKFVEMINGMIKAMIEKHNKTAEEEEDEV